MPPSVTTNGRHLEPGDRQPLEIAASDPDRDRRQGSGAPAVADAALADGEAVLEPALLHRRGHEAGESEQRADRKIDAGGQDHEGHADREQAGDRHLPHHVEEIDRRKEPRLDDRKQRHQRDEEQRRRESGDEAEHVDAAEPGSVRRLSCRSWRGLKKSAARRRPRRRGRSSSTSGFPGSHRCGRSRRSPGPRAW